MLNWERMVREAVTIRKQERLSQRDIAALAGVTQPTVVKFEKGSTSIRVDSALAILRALSLAERQDLPPSR